MALGWWFVSRRKKSIFAAETALAVSSSQKSVVLTMLVNLTILIDFSEYPSLLILRRPGRGIKGQIQSGKFTRDRHGSLHVYGCNRA